VIKKSHAITLAALSFLVSGVACSVAVQTYPAGWLTIIALTVSILALLAGTALVVEILVHNHKPPSNELKFGKIRDVKIPCSVCAKPLEDGQIVAWRGTETPWHVEHENLSAPRKKVEASDQVR